jgi:RHS repeat-associated protein
LGQASRAGTFATGVTYFPNGGMSGFTYGACNGTDCIQHTLTQNERQLPLVTLDKRANDVAVIDSTYAYDANGNVASITDSGNYLTRTRDQLTYDGLDRLTHAHGPNVAWLNADTAYDPLDNIRSNTVGARTWTYQYDANNRLASLLKPTTTTITHDVRGNVTSNGVDAFAFDAANRLMAVTGKETYAYDGHGRRVAMKRTSDGKTAYPMYSLAGQLITDEDNRSDRTTDYVYLNGSLVAKRSKPVNGSTWTTRYLHTDALGRPIAETDATAVVQHVENFTPYGEQSDTLAGAAREQGPAFTGHMTDAGTGLSYMQQRYYDPMLGRFLSVDPVAANGARGANFNRYWYANNNPYKFTDPDGREGACIYSASMCGSRELTSEQKQQQEDAAQTVRSFVPGADLLDCMKSGCGGLGWAVAGLGAIPLEGKLGQIGIRGLAWVGGAGKSVITFGKNANQVSHAFRHTVDAGLSVRDVATRVSRDVNKIAGTLETGKTINRIVTVDGKTLQYAVHKLEDGTMRVGRIKVLRDH